VVLRRKRQPKKSLYNGIKHRMHEDGDNNLTRSKRYRDGGEYNYDKIAMENKHGGLSVIV